MIRNVYDFIIEQIWNGRALRVLAAGGVGFVVQTVIFEILGIWLKLVTPAVATLIGAECAILTNFFLNERFSFRDMIDHTKPRWKRLARFHVVVLGSLAAQFASVFTAEHATSNFLIIHLAYIFGVGFGFILNYIGYMFVVWRR